MEVRGVLRRQFNVLDIESNRLAIAKYERISVDIIKSIWITPISRFCTRLVRPNRTTRNILKYKTIKLPLGINKKFIQNSLVKNCFLCNLDDGRDNNQVRRFVLWKIRTRQQVVPRRAMKTKRRTQGATGTIQPVF